MSIAAGVQCRGRLRTSAVASASSRYADTRGGSGAGGAGFDDMAMSPSRKSREPPYHPVN
jgi:hypothetical protein